MMRTILFVALGGAAGALARFGVAHLVARVWDGALPLATWGANLLGCLLIGVALATVGEDADGVRALVIVGFLGAFTTFSTFSAETVVLLQRGLVGAAVLNVAGSVVLGLLCVWAGLRLGTWIAAPAG